MADWPLHGGGPTSAIGTVPGTSTNTSVTAGAVNTKGAWAQLVAASAHDTEAIILGIRPVTAAVRYLLDIGIGPAGSEQVILPNIHMGNGVATQLNNILLVGIPAGTRVSARCQASTAGSVMKVAATLMAQGFLPSESLNRATAYGVNLATSGGTSIDPGLVANTKPATFTQVVAATTAPIRHLYVAVGGQGRSTLAVGDFLVDIAVGGAATEQVVVPDIPFRVTGTTSPTPPMLGPFLVNIPAGSRLSMRAQSTITTAERLLDFALYGLD